MADFPALPLWTDADQLQLRLISDGWLSPNTYSSHFSPLIQGSAVYLLMVFVRGDYSRCWVAYVGCSTNLSKHRCYHKKSAHMRAKNLWVKRWFKPTPQPHLHELKQSLIESYRPPWNTIGKPRKMVP